MATHTGSEGTIKADADTVIEIRSYTLNDSADIIEKTTMGGTSRSFKSSLLSFDGTVEVYWHEDDFDGQVDLEIGSEVTINICPEGDAVGDTYYSGTAIITSRSTAASLDGLVEMSIGVKGTSTLHYSIDWFLLQEDNSYLWQEDGSRLLRVQDIRLLS